MPVDVVDLSRFAASKLGYQFPDPNPEVQRQWAVFEAMIALMTPQGFADLMGTMWPELISAMPFGMGRMMRAMGRVPLALDLMKPMFPVLFPRLLPMMMPKVMPTMLERIAERVPMPDYMAEQFPGMMPGIMDNLMPHMIKDVVPLVTDPMIAYLKNEAAAGGNGGGTGAGAAAGGNGSRRALHKLAPMDPREACLDVPAVVRTVAAFLGTTADTLAARTRRRDVLAQRQLAMYLCRQYTDAPLVAIARAFGRDHPSAANAVRKVERAILERAPLRYQVEELAARLERLRRR